MDTFAQSLLSHGKEVEKENLELNIPLSSQGKVIPILFSSWPKPGNRTGDTISELDRRRRGSITHERPGKFQS